MSRTPPVWKNQIMTNPPYTAGSLTFWISSRVCACAGNIGNVHKSDRKGDEMDKTMASSATYKKYKKELMEIEDAARAANCDTNFLYRTTLDRYVTQTDLIIAAEKDLQENGLTVIRVTPKGAEVETENPAIRIYNQTASAANSTISALLRIVQTFKFMAAKPSEDDEL